LTHVSHVRTGEGAKTSLDLTLILRVLIFPGLSFIVLLTLLCDWVERKMEARMQNRVGPAYTGPAGILQPFADFVKLLAKEDMVPLNARSVIFKIAPILSFSTFVFAMFFLPIDGSNVILNSSFQGDLIVVLALISVANFFLFLSGWASSNSYSEIGATRVLTQFLGYDIPLSILAICPAVLASALSISVIAASQSVPFVLLLPWVFVLFIITLQAELEKDPFDVPHAETEIVGGYETEYTGRRLAFLKLSKDVQIVLGAVLVTELFLGGPYGPVFIGPPETWYTLWFVLKVFFVIMITEYLTCLFARLRIDQILRFNWRVLMPLSVLSLAATAAVASLLSTGAW
jgi:NADH-quinone oxidoreductase subunit H